MISPLPDDDGDELPEGCGGNVVKSVTASN